jgi:hypothetical protein
MELRIQEYGAIFASFDGSFVPRRYVDAHKQRDRTYIEKSASNDGSRMDIIVERCSFVMLMS